jgi:hypothetical protein
MRGTLLLVELSALDSLHPNHPLLETLGVIDRTAHLPFSASGAEGDLQQEGYWMVLKLCAEMGMISGRGVTI